MTLRDYPPGSHLLLRKVTEKSSRRRLAEWGLVPGAHLRLIAHSLGGGLIVAVGDARLAVDSRTAATVIVEPDQ